LWSCPEAAGGPQSTIHVSVLDAEGNGAAVTFSYGEGNGHLIGDSGIMMNNLMGEEDLFPGGFHRWPVGTRLATMMSPTVVTNEAGDVLVLGTGGANRIRTALTQVISNIVDHGFSTAEAVHAPRVHFEAGVLNAEVFDRPDEGAAVGLLGAAEEVRFEQPNLFFGGVHMVRRRADGTFSGAGDHRRGGVCLIAD